MSEIKSDEAAREEFLDLLENFSEVGHEYRRFEFRAIKALRAIRKKIHRGEPLEGANENLAIINVTLKMTTEYIDDAATWTGVLSGNLGGDSDE